MPVESVVTLVSIILALVSVICGIASLRYGARFHREVEASFTKVIDSARKLVERVSQVEEHLSTQEIGRFPDHLLQIAALLSKAKEEILIVSQSGGYASFSAPSLFLEYESELRRRSLDGVSIRAILPSASIMAKLRQEQFSHGAEWDSWLKDEDFQIKLEGFQRRNQLADRIDSYESFIDAVRSDNDRAVDSLKGYCQVKEVDMLIPLQMWIVDRRLAIFSIKSFQGTIVATAFETRDSDLVTSLVSSWEFYAKSVDSE